MSYELYNRVPWIWGSVILRDYMESDLESIADLESKAFTVGPYSRTMLVSVLNQPGSIRVVAVEDGKIAGYAILLPLSRTQADIETIAVLPEFQGKGISDRMMEYLEEKAMERGIEEIILEVRDKNFRAIAFYRKKGYREISYLPRFYHEMYEGSRGAYRMIKRLDQFPSFEVK